MRARYRLAARLLVAAPALCAGLVLAACAAAIEDRTAVADAPEAQVVGEPLECIQTTLLRRSLVRSDRTIDFEMRNGDFYRNTLPSPCPGLGFERRIAYEPRMNRLCSADFFHVLDKNGSRGLVCGFGEFVPVELVERAAG